MRGKRRIFTHIALHSIWVLLLLVACNKQPTRTPAATELAPEEPTGEPAEEPAEETAGVTTEGPEEEAAEPTEEVSQEPTAGPTVEPTTTTTPAVSNERFCQQADWTVMIYLAVDNDLGRDPLASPSDPPSMGEEMLEDIAAGADYQLGLDQQRLNVVVLYDQLDDGNSQLWVKSCADAEPFHQLDDYEALAEYLPDLAADYHEVNTGDGQTLHGFVAWAQSNYPADHYLLSLVSHGYGITPDDPTDVGAGRPAGALASIARPPAQPGLQWGLGGTGLAFDYTYYDANRDLIESVADADALSTAELGLLSDLHVDVLFFHACLMSMLEVAYEVAGYTDYIIAGQNYLFGPGDYEANLIQLTNDIAAGQNSAKIAGNWAIEYFVTLTRTRPPLPLEVTVINSSLAQVAMNDWHELGSALLDLLEADETSTLDNLRMAMDRAGQYYDINDDKLLDQLDSYVDAISLANAIAGVFSYDANISRLASEAAGSTAGAMVWYQPGSYDGIDWDLSRSRGLSIFFPVYQELWMGGDCPDEANAGENSLDYGACYSLTATYHDDNYAFATAGGMARGWDELVHFLAGNTTIPVHTLTKARAGLLPMGD
ncbi:MAG: clostripain-related cysteine peptidase [Chloroflexi bacterium]|nr:clostripain-related cysteine peptidase [Chloroflexota bacterium]MCI0575504.1 clostripain-related cysteine peptidase [Chloroflexota bacterium]MCI0647181.1 clostripain-related cysteine peptidase [Chloroflexota bacterium]